MESELAKSLSKIILERKSALFIGREVSLKAGVPSIDVVTSALGSKFNIPDEDRSNINLVVSEIEKTIPDGRKRIVEEVYGMIEPVAPSNLLKSIPLFRWKAIYTWNFDSLIEKAYEECFDEAVQSLSVISEPIKMMSVNDADNVCLFKMYGSIRDPLNKRARLVLTRQDIAATDKNRVELLSIVKDIYPPLNLVFIGFNVDQEFLDILANVQEVTYKTSDAFLIRPQELDREKLRELKDLRCQVIKTDPDAFFEMMYSSHLAETSIREKEKSIFAVIEGKEDIKVTYADYKKLSSELLIFCEHEFEEDRKQNTGKQAKDFYEGEEIWLSGLEQKFAIERDILATLLEGVEKDLRREKEGTAKFRNRVFALLYDHPGAGGTTALKMLGYAVYRKKRHPVLMVRSKRMSSRLDFDAIVRFCESLPTKPLILVDDLSKDKDNFKFLFTLFDSRRTSATFVICCRQEEWDEDYYIGLSYFDEDYQEIKENVQPIDEYKLPLKGLGLKGNAILFLLSEKISAREKYELFRKTIEAGIVQDDMFNYEKWQDLYNDDILLVLLYRIFKNAKLEFVIIDEYRALKKKNAQAAYAYEVICALNALRLNISWELLRRILSCEWSVLLDLPKTFGGVVKPDFQFDTNLFRARHHLIAEKLFDMLYDEADKKLTLFEEIIRNISPNNDNERNLLRQIVLNKKLHDALGRLSYSSRIFKSARDIVPYDPVVIQHLGITLMKMGKDEDAVAAYTKALEFHPENPAVYNSEGILFEKMALKMLSQSEPDDIKVGVYLKKAHEAFRKSILYGRDTEHGYDRYGRFLLKSATKLFQKESPQWQEYVGMVRGLIEDARDNVSDVRLKFIDDLESRLKDEIGDTEGAIAICKDLLRVDPSSHNVRYNLSWLLFKTREYKQALDTLKPSIDEEVKEFRFFKLYAKLLLILKPDHLKEIKRILEAANSLNAEDLDVNFRLAVVYYKEAELGKAFSYFRNCDSLSYKRPDRFKIKMNFGDGSQKKLFFGTVKSRVHAARGYITRDLWGDDIFFNPARNSNVEAGQRVRFNIGFCYVGPQALDIVPEQRDEVKKE